MAGTADATLELLHKLDDPTAWDCVKDGVPIFCLHEREIAVTDADGHRKTQTIKVDEDRLHRIADTINRKAAESGVLIRLTRGHMTPGKSQEEQPVLVGFARNVRVGHYGPNGSKIGLLAKTWIAKGCQSTLDGYLYRSSEFYPRKNDITAVALLKTDPALDLGMVAYASGEVGYYQTERLNMAELTMQPTAPTAPPIDLDTLVERVVGRVRQEVLGTPLMRHLQVQYSAYLSATNGGNGTAKRAEDDEDETRGKKKDDDTSKKKASSSDDEEERADMGRRDAPQHYAALVEETRHLRQGLDEARKQLALAECERLADSLAGYSFDRQSKIDYWLPLTPEQRAKDVDLTRKHSKQDPTSPLVLRYAGSGHEGGTDAAGVAAGLPLVEGTPERPISYWDEGVRTELDVVLAYMKTHGLATYEEAERAYREGTQRKTKSA